ncbi:hypothetical protein [Sinorhizobium meliloti]|uniref:hypothetical protein n=1 Tax=Rhizobium meliloti TaxID=382 RepID=UPI0013E2BC50|nr:hypothetical protein [Sinorhizobium meliloti]
MSSRLAATDLRLSTRCNQHIDSRDCTGRLHRSAYAMVASKKPDVIPRKSWAALAKGGEWRAKVTPEPDRQAVSEFNGDRYGADERLLVTGVVIYQDIFDRYFRTEFAFFSHNDIGTVLSAERFAGRIR